MILPGNVMVPQLGRPEREHIWGIPFTGAEPKFTHNAGNIWFVDRTLGHDEADGETPDKAFKTMQAAVDNDRLANNDVIYALTDLTESVVTPNWADTARWVSIIGVGNGYYSPAWRSAAAAEPALDMRARGWRVSGFKFPAPTAAFSIEIRYADVDAGAVALHTIIERNFFNGDTVGLGGVNTHGCYDVVIANNIFHLFHNAGGTACALYTGVCPIAIPMRNQVVGNLFYENDNHMDFPCNNSFIMDNVFQKVGFTYTATVVLRTLRDGAGDDNVVTRNHFQGDYSIAGGYIPGPADDWTGNVAEDVAEVEVADNGFTVARPA